MSNYRRLISYIYAYEGGIKGKNIGFAKLEARNGQCRISVNVKKVYVGGNDLGVYLLAGSQEILLGKIFIRNGAGEFRASVPAANIGGSGVSLDECYGLTIHDVESAWQCYTTIWEDAVAHAAELELSEVTSENRREKEPASVEEITAEIHAEVESSVKAEEANPAPSATIPDKEEVRNLPFPDGEPAEKEKESLEENQSVQQQEATPAETKHPQMPQPDLEPNLSASGPEQVLPPVMDSENGQDQEMPSDAQAAREQDYPKFYTQPPLKQFTEPGDEEELKRLDQEEEESAGHHEIWQRFRKTYPKLDAFDYEKGCEVLTIKPQDIGLLPREIWVYGNNSFLLHGYYNYRYLILAKLNNPQGQPRYLLGVPGHYYSNEKYMASMFGFSNFVLAKNQPMQDGRFGYWYTDVRLDM